MGSRGKSRPVFSLLAFQDIITSVSGILMFLVLMLSLELTDQPANSSPPEPQPDITALQSELEASRAERDRLEKSISQNDELAKLTAAAAPLQIKADIEHLSARVAAEDVANRQLADQLNELASAVEDVGRKNESALKTGAEAEKLRAKAESLRRELEAVQSDGRPVFTLPKGFNKSGWLVVVTKSACEAAPLGRKASPRHFRIGAGLLSDTPDVSDFLDWANSVEGGRSYFLLIVRPGASDVFRAIEESFITRGTEFGFDLAGPNEELLDPEKGAFH